MSPRAPLPFTAPLAQYQAQAEDLWRALQSGSDDARWKFKWEHPRYRGKHVHEVDPKALDLDDARTVLAREYAFETWADLSRFTTAIQEDPGVARFEAAVEAVIAGDLPTLRALLREDPELPRARSTRRHRATLLHYLAANGVEGMRQQTPANAVEVAKTLLDAGAEVDALAEMYDAKCTTMSMLVSSAPPAAAGLQAALVETLLDHGAELEGPGSNWQSTLKTALAFGYHETAQALARRGARVDLLPAAAGLGRVEDVARLLPGADAPDRQVALALAAQHGHAAIVAMLLDAGEDPNRYNPNGFHPHSMPLHQAIAAGHAEVVRLLVERGARLDVRDKVYDGTPLGWAIYCEKPAIADYLRGRGAP